MTRPGSTTLELLPQCASLCLLCSPPTAKPRAMNRQSEAENRALDARCRLPTSPASRTAVVRLRALSSFSQGMCLWNYAECDLPHLVRCALEAVRHRCAGALRLSYSLPAHSSRRASQPTRAGARKARPCCSSPPRRAANER